MQLLDGTPCIFLIIESSTKAKAIVGQQTTSFSLAGLVRWLRTQKIKTTYIHFLSTSIAYLLLRVGLADKPLYWIMWGADFYRLPQVRRNYFLPLSEKFMPPINSIKSRIIMFMSLPSYNHVDKILPKVDYFVGYPEEYEHVQKELNLPMELIPWEFYFDVTEMERPAINFGSGHILIGNSDDPTNNHLDILNLLLDRGMKEFPLIMPLAGASSDYQLAIADKIIGFDSDILSEYVDPKTFFQKMEKVSYVIYGHLRQQGVGTILPLIYAGKKVFLWESNPLFSILKRWGVLIFSLDKMSLEDLVPLTQMQVEGQRKTLEEFNSHAKGNERWKKILQDRSQKKVDLN